MTSTFTLRDAYSQWLGIPQAELPPHHYRLLGIPAMEADTQTILAAYGARTAIASAHLAGEHGDIARRLLGELAAAQACLLNPQAKYEYDRELSARLGDASAAKEQPAGGFVRRPQPRSKSEFAAAPVAAHGEHSAAEAASTPIAGGGLAYRDPGEPASALPWLIGGVCAGLLGVSVLGLILFAGPRGKKSSGDQAAAAGNVQTSAAQQRAGGDQHSQRPAIPRIRRNEDAAGNHLAPNTNQAASLRWDKEPAGATGSGELLGVKDLGGGDAAATGEGSTSAVDETAPAEPPTETTPVAVNPLAALPRAVKLPRPNTGANVPAGPIVLTRIDVDTTEPVALKLSASALVSNGRYELLPRSASEAGAGEDGVEGEVAPQMWDVQHTSADGKSNIVGAYELADGELAFAWSPDATAEEIAQLQNQPLEISAGEFAAKIAQRTPDEIPPLLVKVDSGAITSLAVIESPPENADIFLAVEEFGSDFPAHQWEPASEIRLGKHSDLRFGAPEDTYQLALRFTAESAGPNKVRIEARPMFREGDSQKWDYFRPKSAAQLLAALQAEEALIDAQMEQIRQRFRRNPAAQQQASAALNQKSTVLQQRIANLQRISDDCQAMQDKAQIHFRLYAQDGETQIDLVQTSKDESAAAAESPKPAADPNIGAPIEAVPDPAPEAPPPAE